MSMTDIIAARAAARATYDSEEEWEVTLRGRLTAPILWMDGPSMRLTPYGEALTAGPHVPGVKDPATRQPWELPDPVPPIVHPVNPYKDGGTPDPVEIVIPPPSEPKEPRVDTEWPPAPPMPAPKRRK